MVPEMEPLQGEMRAFKAISCSDLLLCSCFPNQSVKTSVHCMSYTVLVESVAQTFNNCHNKSVILRSKSILISVYPKADNCDAASERDGCNSCDNAPVHTVVWFKARSVPNLPYDLLLVSLTLKNDVGCISLNLTYTWEIETRPTTLT